MTRAEAGRIGGLIASARNDPRQLTAEARRAFTVDRFERQVDPEGVLDPQERRRRADAARKAHMLRLAARSAEVRAGRKAAKGR